MMLSEEEEEEDEDSELEPKAVLGGEAQDDVTIGKYLVGEHLANNQIAQDAEPVQKTAVRA